MLAAEDATSLGPKLDAVLFVLRLGQTTSRQAKKSLDLLYGRQANILGVVLNCTDPSMPEYKFINTPAIILPGNPPNANLPIRRRLPSRAESG